MIFGLRGKTALVTGGGSGIGQSICLLFARQGAHVVVLDLSRNAAETTVARIAGEGGSSQALTCDVGDAAAVREAFDELDQAGAGLDILVNNAGVGHVGTLETTDEATFDRITRINVKGVYLCAQAAVRRMRGKGGVILNMASIASLIGIDERFAYSMSKGAVLTMTRSIAVDFMKDGIRCNCICPARVHITLADRYLAENYPGREAALFEQLSSYQPMGRMGTPDEVAALALYLCSDEASFITGQAFPIDGGVLVK